MSSTRRQACPSVHERLVHWGTLATLCLIPMWAQAEIGLSSDWNGTKTCTGMPHSNAELAEVQNGLRPQPVCTKTETERLLEAAGQSAVARAAALSRSGDKPRDYWVDRGFKLSLDGRLHYLAPLKFMTKSRPGEVCTPSDFTGQPTYQCDEGQRQTMDCHLLIFNERFEEVGYHRIEVKEPYPFFCNAVPALGVGNAADNLLLATIQYFPIDRKHASKISEVGSRWQRMTAAFRLTLQGDGRVLIEQDDRCLKNPNRIEAIPDARRRLKRCMTHSE